MDSRLGPRGIRPRVRHLTVVLVVSGVLAGLGGAVAAVVGGTVGATGFVCGAALVTTSYTVSTVAVAWADTVHPRLVFAVGMGLYVTKFSLFGMLLLAIGGSGWPGRVPMAVGIVAAVVGWTASQIWWTVTIGGHASEVPAPAQR